jgi:hypothetical protein
MMTTQFNRLLLLYPAISAVFLLTPTEAGAAWLPGWGSSDGTPNVTVGWCSSTNDKRHVGDFDGDGLTDLLCHASLSGRMRIDYSSEYRGFWGTDWDTLDYPESTDQNWCINSGELLFIGDFDGDGQDDLLCYVRRGYTNAGRKRIDFADPWGKFHGADFDTLDYPTAAQTWCTNEGESIFVGDFNGDGKDDLLCYVAAGYDYYGRKRLDYANSAGTFFGTEYDTLSHPEVAQNWCTNAGESLRVGDFSGDGKDDLLCHVNQGYTNAGRRRIDFFGTTSEPFAGTDFNSQNEQSAAQSWCAQTGDKLRIGDVNADGKEDLLCANSTANSSYGSIRVDHANSSGEFFGTNGDLHDEEWCKGSTKDFHVGDFDGDGGDDVLCHDSSSGYRGIRYANGVGDFFSVCSDDSVLGDGELPPLPVHFAVVANPNDPNVPDRLSASYGRIPTSTSDHVHPFDGTAIDDDPWLYFEAEVEVMNYYTYAVGGTDPDGDVCIDNDCIEYEYDSHKLYSELGSLDSSCTRVWNYTNYPEEKYAIGCWSSSTYGATLAERKAACFPNACGSPDSDDTEDDAYNEAFGCAIRQCNDRRLRKPHTLNVVVMDRCEWGNGGVDDASCVVTNKSQSFGFGGTDFFTGWDYGRMLRGPHASALSRAWPTNGLEEHELGHVLSLGHTKSCDGGIAQSNEENPMDIDGGDCGADAGSPVPWREGPYTTGIYTITEVDNDVVDQVEVMVTAARNRVVAWSCN